MVKNLKGGGEQFVSVTYKRSKADWLLPDY
jgi:hypothetical protein